MDEHGLPLVGSGIDYTKVESIKPQYTVVFLNTFVAQTAQFLNQFSRVCEEKLAALSVRLQQLDTMLSILETKLSSVPGLETITAPEASGAGVPPEAAAGTTPAAEPAPPSADPSATAQPQLPGAADPAPEPAPPAEVRAKVQDDSRYAGYFKMLKVGVPEPVVKAKMAREGHDPDLLETPDAPAPPLATASDDSDGFGPDDDDSFSD